MIKVIGFESWEGLGLNIAGGELQVPTNTQNVIIPSKQERVVVPGPGAGSTILGALTNLGKCWICTKLIRSLPCSIFANSSLFTTLVNSVFCTILVYSPLGDYQCAHKPHKCFVWKFVYLPTGEYWWLWRDVTSRPNTRSRSVGEGNPATVCAHLMP